MSSLKIKAFCRLLSIGLILGACRPSVSDTDATATEPSEETTPTEIEVVENQSIEEESSKVNETVQVINSTAEFTRKVCEFDEEKGVRFKGQLPAIVDFYADWCGPCRSIAPFMEEFAKKYSGQIIIYKVNIDRHADLAESFGIESIPTLLFFHPTKQPQSVVGAMSHDELEETIQKLLLN